MQDVDIVEKLFKPRDKVFLTLRRLSRYPGVEDEVQLLRTEIGELVKKIYPNVVTSYAGILYIVDRDDCIKMEREIYIKFIRIIKKSSIVLYDSDDLDKINKLKVDEFINNPDIIDQFLEINIEYSVYNIYKRIKEFYFGFIEEFMNMDVIPQDKFLKSIDDILKIFKTMTLSDLELLNIDNIFDGISVDEFISYLESMYFKVKSSPIVKTHISDLDEDICSFEKRKVTHYISHDKFDFSRLEKINYELLGYERAVRIIRSCGARFNFQDSFNIAFSEILPVLINLKKSLIELKNNNFSIDELKDNKEIIRSFYKEGKDGLTFDLREFYIDFINLEKPLTKLKDWQIEKIDKILFRIDGYIKAHDRISNMFTLQ